MTEDDDKRKKLEELEKLRAQREQYRQNWDTSSSINLDVVDLDKWQDDVGDSWRLGAGNSSNPQGSTAPTGDWSRTASAGTSSSSTTEAVSGAPAAPAPASHPTPAAQQQQAPKPQGQGDNYEWAPPPDAAAKDYAWVPTDTTVKSAAQARQEAREQQSITLPPGVTKYEGISEADLLAPGQRPKKMQTAEDLQKQAELDAKRVQQKGEYDKAITLMQGGDAKSALRLLKELASDGSADAQFKLGVFYQKGEGISRDLARAALWFEKAALQDHPKAQYNLGLMYKDGLGVEADHRRAMMWWELAAKQGHVNSQFNLVAICKHYAEKGDAAAMYKLARMHFRGAGVEASKELAFHWFLHSMKLDYPPAVYWVGLCYENGWGCDMDMNRAVRAYDHAYRLGLVEAGAKIKSSQAQQILKEGRQATQSTTSARPGTIQIGNKQDSPWKNRLD